MTISELAEALDITPKIYKPIVDEWALYDNSSRTPILVEEGGRQ